MLYANVAKTDLAWTWLMGHLHFPMEMAHQESAKRIQLAHAKYFSFFWVNSSIGRSEFWVY